VTVLVDRTGGQREQQALGQAGRGQVTICAGLASSASTATSGSASS
jgi:hypothetical protein